MESVIESKVFLDCGDVSKLFGCSSTKSYQIINRVNFRLEKDGFETMRGRVLARALYEDYGMVEQAITHKEYFKEQSKKRS